MERKDKIIIAVGIAIRFLAVFLIIEGFLSVITAFASDEVIETELEYDDIFQSMTDEDYRALERVVYWEASRAECPLETEVAVVETIMNRVLDDEWPDTVAGVCNDTRWGQQFVHKKLPSKVTDKAMELTSDAIAYVMHYGRTQLPSVKYQYFATKMQSLGKNHIWIGKKGKGKGMYFCEEK